MANPVKRKLARRNIILPVIQAGRIFQMGGNQYIIDRNGCWRKVK